MAAEPGGELNGRLSGGGSAALTPDDAAWGDTGPDSQLSSQEETLDEECTQVRWGCGWG